jgi:chromosome segregation ATPase
LAQEDNELSKLRQKVTQKKKEVEVYTIHVSHLENTVVYEDTRVKRFKNEIEALGNSFKDKLASIEKRKALIKKREMGLDTIRVSIEDSKYKNCEKIHAIQEMHRRIRGIETEVNTMEKNLENKESELKASAALLHSQFYILQKTC